MRLNEKEKQTLLKAAEKARENAYAPYSHFRVGAALLGESGKIYPGCNVENASYGLTLCAERNALTRAIADGEQQFRGIAIVAAEWAPPCGACRQVLAEFGDMDVVLGLGKEQKCYSLSTLLPMQFSIGEKED